MSLAKHEPWNELLLWQSSPNLSISLMPGHAPRFPFFLFHIKRLLPKGQIIAWGSARHVGQGGGGGVTVSCQDKQRSAVMRSRKRGGLLKNKRYFTLQKKDRKSYLP